MELAGDFPAAGERYRAVWRAVPGFSQAAVDWGRMLEQAGDADGAIAAYSEAPLDPAAVEAMAQLLLKENRATDAAAAYAKLHVLRPEWPDAVRFQAEATLPVDPVAAAELFARYQEYPSVKAEEASPTLLAIAAALRMAGMAEEERKFLASAALRWPELDANPTFMEQRRRGEMELLASQLAGAAPEPLDAVGREQLAKARQAFSSGKWAEARRLLRELVDRYPRNPESQAVLADVLEVLSEPGLAEQHLLRAMAFDPLEPLWPARLGDILVKWYGGRRNREAVEWYRRSLLLDPTNAELWRRRARAEQNLVSDDVLAARMQSLERYLLLSPAGEGAADAQAALEGYRREIPVKPTIDPGPGRPAYIPEGAWTAYWLAEAYALQGYDEQAASEVDRALLAYPDYVEAWNLRARLACSRPETLASGLEFYRKSLEIKPDQPAVIEALAMANPQASEALWQQAAAAGSVDAHYFLAKSDFERHRLWSAREHLGFYLSQATGGDLYDRGVALNRQIEERIWQSGAVGGLAIVGVASVPVWWWRRRRGGVALEQLLRQSPASFHEVAGIVSVIRHEILKHHLTVLVPVAAALEAGDAGPSKWMAERLFGAGGAVPRFWEHVAELEAVGRAHGVSLNLRFQDPVFAPLCSAMTALGRLEKPLKKGSGYRLASKLREIAGQMQGDNYRALGTLIRRLCVMDVREEAFLAVWDRLPTSDVELVLDCERGGRVRIYPGEFDDIFANLLRNAAEASRDAGQTQVGVAVRTEDDPITGLESVVIEVRDRSPHRLSTAMIRGRYIERGLGLTVDRISKNGGSIKVEDCEGWSKAVVVRLPCPENEVEE